MISRFFSSFTNSFKAAGWITRAATLEGPPEDAYLTSEKLLTLCDGLGTWKPRGVDPGKHAWKLCQNIAKAHQFLPEDQKYNPHIVLKHAVKETTEFGSSTCVLVILHPEQSVLHCGLVGDSGLLILRKSQNDVVKVAETHEDVKEFDKPHTFGFEGKDPDEALYEKYEIKDKDIVILYSDGVSHNLFQEQVIRVVKPFMLLHEIPDLEIVAEMITEKAQAFSIDENVDKPYGSEKGDHKLGKINDATVVIAEISIKTISI